MKTNTLTKRQLWKMIYGVEPRNSDRRYSRHTTKTLFEEARKKNLLVGGAHV